MTLAQIINHQLAMSDDLHEWINQDSQKPSDFYPTDTEIVDWYSHETSIVETLIDEMIGGE